MRRRTADSNPFDLQGQYCNDTVGAPGWHECQDLDSAAFATKFAYHIWSKSDAAQEAAALYQRWGNSHEHCGGRLGCVFQKRQTMIVRTGPALARSIRATTTSPRGNGLLWSNTSRPMIGYGFQDSLFKSGEVLYSSVSRHDIAAIWAAFLSRRQ